jgi:predicted anti-sigma-YlaC factor YlaD
MKCDEVKILLSALVDDELTPPQKTMAGNHLAECADCRREYERLRKLKEATDDMKYFDVPDKLWAGYWHGIYNRIERGLGWIFLSMGVIILLILGAWELLNNFFLDVKQPLILKIGIGALIVGLIVLLVSVGRERLFSRAHDRYEEVNL